MLERECICDLQSFNFLPEVEVRVLPEDEFMVYAARVAACGLCLMLGHTVDDKKAYVAKLVAAGMLCDNIMAERNSVYAETRKRIQRECDQMLMASKAPYN